MIVLMEQIIIYLALALFGLVFGSFAGASIWRLRASQLVQDKKDGEHVDCDEYDSLKKLTKSSILNDRSRCLHCPYILRWYDLMPLFSWISLGGKCRKCRKPIGYLEPAIEICVALFFVISYIFWPSALNSSLEIMRFMIWLMAGVGLAILFTYDAKWYLLPDRVNFIIIGLGVINAILVILSSSDRVSAVIGVAGSVAILSGIYWGLYQISSGKWIGFGDVKLGLGLALLLADWKLAFIALFAANLIGCIIVLPSMAKGRLKRDSHVPFGPLLIIGYILAGLCGHYIISVLFL